MYGVVLNQARVEKKYLNLNKWNII